MTKHWKNKHKFNRSWVDGSDSDFSVSFTPISPPPPSFWKPVFITVNKINSNLPDCFYDLALQEDLTSEIFMDCLEEIDTNLDTFYMHHGNVTICNDKPGCQVYETPPQSTGDTHGEQYYPDINSNFICVFVSETKAVGESPINSAFWAPYFANDNITRYIFHQGILSIGNDYHISIQDAKEAMSPMEPRISTPTKFGHEAMRPFFAYLPFDRIKATFKHTTQLMKMPSSTYLRKRHQTPHPAANIVRQRETDFGDVIYFNVPAIDGGETAAQLWTGQQRRSKKSIIQPEIILLN